MKLNFKRLMAMLLSIMMVVSLLPTIVLAEDITLGGDFDLSNPGSSGGESSTEAVFTVGNFFTTTADTLQEAIDDAVRYCYEMIGNVAILGTPVITLNENYELEAPVVVDSDYPIIIDLNGHEITYNSTTQGEAMITNNGDLTINDSVGTGVINYNYTGGADNTYSKGNYTISNAGTLTVNGGKITIANLSGHAKYPIDNNSTTGDAILVINGGHLYNYNTSAIRQFCNSTTYMNSVTVNGGLVEGYCAIWVQNPGSKTVNGNLSIAGGEIKTTAKAYVNGTSALEDVSSGIYFTIDGNGGAWSDTSAVSITGGIINENVNLTAEAPADITVDMTNANFNGKVETPAPAVTYVAMIGAQGYASLAEAVAAAQDGDTIVIISNISDEAITVDKSLTITGDATLTNVSINGTAGTLTVSNLTFAGNSWINAGGCDELVVKNVTANVAPSNGSYTNSRNAFIGLGRSEAKQLKLTVTDCEIIVPSGTDAVLGWAAVTEVTISGNTFGSETSYQNNGDIVKFMAIANGAVLNITNNTSYSNYNGFVFAQNTTRDNAYSVHVDENKFYGEADHLWIEITGGNTVNAKIEATSDNTVNGNAFTAADIKYHSGAIKNWNGYAGVDVTKDSEGKLTGGSFLLEPSTDLLAEGYEVKQNADGTYGVAEEAPAYVAEVNGVGYVTLAEALAAAKSIQENVTIKLLADCEETLVTVDSNVTLDLNGNTLTAYYAIGFKGSNIIDSSADNSGRLKTENAVFAGNNAQLPVKTADGYAFAEYVDNIRSAKRLESNGSVTYAFKLADIEADLLDDIMNADSAVTFEVRLSWTTTEYSTNQDFVYNNRMVSGVLNSYNSGNFSQVFTVNLNEVWIASANQMKISFVVKSNNVVIYSSSAVDVK